MTSGKEGVPSERPIRREDPIQQPVAPEPAARIVRIGLNVADLGRSVAFYEQGLGFARCASGRHEGSAWGAQIGIDGAAASFARLRLGRQEIELTQFDRPGMPYPEPRHANDPWFQHFAIAVSDMERAYAMLSRQSYPAISVGGPQQLPPSTGSVIAFKFRDPDGHPLELSYSSTGCWEDPANAPPPGELFLGIDHSAIVVADLDRSIAFYAREFGFTVIARLLNEGPAQERLDGLRDAEVDIVVLKTAAGGPHLELLHYRRPASAETNSFPSMHEIAATRLTIATGPLPPKLDVASGMVMLRDPDGHLIENRARLT